MTEDGPPYMRPKEVAGILDWHPNTIRAHIVPIDEWTPGSDKIPARRIGSRWHIPRSWVYEMWRAGTTPPGEAT